MTLNDLLAKKGIDARTVLVLRHRPVEPDLRAVLPWLAAERPEVFNAYQQTQGRVVERAMAGAAFVASFIGHEPGKAVFVGLFRVAGSRVVSRSELRQEPGYRELLTLGLRPDDAARALWFDLQPTDFYAEWKGKLVVAWPPPERSWWRRAHKNEFAISAIHEASLLVSRMPHWQELTLAWDQLRMLPAPWAARLAEWRGIYFIFDSLDGKGYVGSAYGAENLLGRWRNYAADGHGGNVLLRARTPETFQFSILERVSPDMPAEDVIRLEATWKERLHTRRPLGLNDN